MLFIRIQMLNIISVLETYAFIQNNSSGDNNIAIGNRALYSAAGGGILNVAIGGLALYNATGFEYK